MALEPRVSQGSASIVPGTVGESVSQPGWPGPALQPNQLFSALTTSGRSERFLMPAPVLSTRRLKWAVTPPTVLVTLMPTKELSIVLEFMASGPEAPPKRSTLMAAMDPFWVVLALVM